MESVKPRAGMDRSNKVIYFCFVRRKSRGKFKQLSQGIFATDAMMLPTDMFVEKLFEDHRRAALRCVG